MAHADYACCCICASKMDYEGFSENHKRRLCAACAVALMEQGVKAICSDDVFAWMKNNNAATVLPVLSAVGFKPCWYDNYIDRRFAELAPTGEGTT